MIDMTQIEHLEQIKDNLQAEVNRLASDIAVLKVQQKIMEQLNG